MQKIQRMRPTGITEFLAGAKPINRQSGYKLTPKRWLFKVDRKRVIQNCQRACFLFSYENIIFF